MTRFRANNYFLLFVVLLLAILIESSNGFMAPSEKAQYHCFQFPTEVPQEEYRRFGSKTKYLKAREEIRRSFNVSWPDDFDRGTCEPINLFFISRHTIRYPSEKEIRKLQQQMPTIQRHLVKDENEKIDLVHKNELINWRLLMHPAEENRVSQAGRFETAVVARIFYQYFPTLLDIKKNEFEVGVSSKIRTTETAEAFVRGLAEMQVRPDHLTFEQSNQLANEQIHKKFYPFYYNKLTMAHNRCKGTAPKNPTEYLELLASESFKQLTAQFRERNGLPDSITIDSVVLIYKACIYETANFYYSPWCSLFVKEELKAIEYLTDLNDYYDAYAYEPHRLIACVVMVDLFKKVDAIVKNPNSPRKTTLYFSHEHLLNKLASNLELFESFDNYEYDEDGRVCIPTNRNWYSAMVIPFNANFAAVLYKCEGNYKLLTLFNEIPVIIRGCKSELCEIEDFYKEYGKLEQKCDVETICP